jgi:hypothetical protein
VSKVYCLVTEKLVIVNLKYIELFVCDPVYFMAGCPVVNATFITRKLEHVHDHTGPIQT